MEKLIQEIQKVFPFKNTTREGDIVLIVFENPQSMVYARVSEIERDQHKRDEWWNVKMHVLAMPPQIIVWTLREVQFTGKEIFTMGGDKRYVRAIDFGEEIKSVPLPKKPKKKPSLRIVK